MEGTDRKVAKKQKTIFIPEDLMGVIEAQERSKGVPISRVVVAALIQYFSAPGSPDDVWMHMAVALDKGELLFSDIPQKAWAVLIQKSAARVKELQACKSHPSNIADAMATFRHFKCMEAASIGLQMIEMDPMPLSTDSEETDSTE